MTDTNPHLILQRLRTVVDRCSYPSFHFVIGRRNDAGYYLQIECSSTCNTTGAPMNWKSRKWMLSQHMTDGEVVQTAFKAVLTALEHEAREQFKYRDTPIFDPHYDVEKLVELRRQAGAIKERD